MDIKDGKKKIYLVVLFILFASLSLIFFVVIPTVEKVYQKKDSLEEAKLMLKRDQENVDRYKKDLEYLKQNYFLSEGLAIDENNRVLMIEDLEKISKETALDMEIEMYNASVNNKKTRKKEGAVEKTLLKISLLGDYRDFLDFAYKLQNFKYLIFIDKLTVEKFDDSQIKNLKGGVLLEALPEIQAEIIVSFNEQKI